MSQNYAVEVGDTPACLVKGFLRGQKGFGDGTHGGSAATPREVWILPVSEEESTARLGNASVCYVGFGDDVDADNGFPVPHWRQTNGGGRDYWPLKMDLWDGDELWAVMDLTTADASKTATVRVIVLHGDGKPPA